MLIKRGFYMRFLSGLFLSFLTLSALAAEGTRVQIKGEVIDTWCYFSGVMGGLMPLSAVRTIPVPCGAVQAVFLLEFWPGTAPCTWF